MSILVESNIEFDFTKAAKVIEHDKPSGHNNHYWPGVDFCIEDAQGWIWLEVKNWDSTHISAERRGGVRWSFICKMKSRVFVKDMHNKFLGTTAFLAWTGDFALSDTRYILLFEPQKPLDSALLLTFNQRLQRDHFPNRAPWVKTIGVAVLPLNEWNMRFPDYPARILP